MNSGWKRRLAYGLAAVLTVMLLVAFARAVKEDGPAAMAAWRSSQVRHEWIALAFGCGLAGHGLNVWGWYRLLRDLGQRVSIAGTAELFLVSGLGRYMPGAKAWQLGIVGVLANEQGISKRVAVASSLFVGGFGVGIGLLLAFLFGGAAVGIPAEWLALAGLSLIGILLAPEIVRRVPAARQQISKRAPLLAEVGVGTMWTLLWTTSASWIVWGVGVYALVNGLVLDPLISLAASVTAWITPFLAGLIAVIAPGGAGARELAMTEILTAGGLTAGGALMVTVMARVWSMILDVGPALAVLGLRQFRKDRGTQE